MDPLTGTPWSDASTVAGFAQGRPNPLLMQYATRELARCGTPIVLDIGCGAGRNAVPMAEAGCDVVGIDLSRPMLDAARERARTARPRARTAWVLAAADALPVRTASCDLVVAHGIWNLAVSGDTLRRAVAEAARASRPGAALFVFTFSRHTLAATAEPLAGETFVFTQFSGTPQCFLTEAQLIAELRTAGFAIEPGTAVREHNRPQPGWLATGAPVIYEAVFRRLP